jgi:hypothetical protein
MYQIYATALYTMPSSKQENILENLLLLLGLWQNLQVNTKILYCNQYKIM